MSDLIARISKERFTFNKMDPACILCPPIEKMAKRLTCEDYEVTKVTISGMGITKDGYLCDPCLKDIKQDPNITVVEE